MKMSYSTVVTLGLLLCTGTLHFDVAVGITVNNYVLSFTTTINGEQTSRQINFNENDYIDSFYLKLCDNSTYYYEMEIADSATYYPLKTISFSREKLNQSLFTDSYNCFGYYSRFNCTRAPKPAGCGNGKTLIQATYSNSSLCGRSSIGLCASLNQNLTVAIFAEEVTTSTVTLTSTKQVTTRRMSNKSSSTFRGVSVFSLVMMFAFSFVSLVLHIPRGQTYFIK
ncbi:hypothetical protein Bpfe_019930 [Biomphalaria pfeifferi]|uniref:Uncharacterized protein n=1 Tax=Biomphalaria pfeifferi TaxID=112525 RepID=A0AAD8B9R9_BIOPF|nr:hypothetical protein Bpfe_019930 [Biomphalaria pfeifferi]